MQKAEKKDQKNARLYVVSGPSGSGKSTLCRAAVDQAGARLSISATTRPRTESETDGVDYYFMAEDEFVAKAEAGEFLEYAKVFDHYYGTPAEPVRKCLQQAQSVVLEIDVQGAMQVFGKFPEAVGILILPPGTGELRQRLQQRRRDDEQTIENRLAKGQWEIDQARASARYQHTIVNDDLAKATDQIKAIIGNESSCLNS